MLTTSKVSSKWARYKILCSWRSYLLSESLWRVYLVPISSALSPYNIQGWGIRPGWMITWGNTERPPIPTASCHSYPRLKFPWCTHGKSGAHKWKTTDMSLAIVLTNTCLDLSSSSVDANSLVRALIDAHFLHKDSSTWTVKNQWKTITLEV
jgi:hypothetical protein